MHRVELKHIPLRAPERFPGLRRLFPVLVLSLFLAAAGLVWARLWLPVSWFPRAVWPEGVLLAMATATTLVSLTRQLPGQNVLLASLLILIAAGGVESLNAVTGLPFGPCVFSESLGRKLFYLLPWPIPFVWLVSLLSSRGVARLVLRPGRQGRNFGCWLLGLTVLLALLLDFGLQPCASKVEQWWSWKPTRLPTDWYGVPWVNFLGRAVTTLLTLAFITPPLLKKKPVSPPPDYHPLVVWCSLMVLFVTGAVTRRLWSTAIFLGLAAVAVAVLAIRGGAMSAPEEGRKRS